MLPKRTEWKSWNTLEKVTYVAQLAAALALLPTVVFAYLGWREARLARDDQTQFFLAEKSPYLEVSDVGISTGLLNLELNNTGDSIAKGITLQVLIIDPKSGRVEPLQLLDLYAKAPLAVQKGHKLAIPVQSNIELQKALGFMPSEVRLYDLKTVDNSGQAQPVLNVIVEYVDVRERPHIAMATAKLIK